IIDFIFTQQLGVVSEVAQKPGEFPHCSGRAVEAASDQTPGQVLGLENSEAKQVIGSLCMPAVSRSLNSDEEESRVDGRPIRGTEAFEVASHAAPSFFGK